MTSRISLSLAAAAAACPRRPAWIAGGRPVSYAEAWDEASALAASLSASGISAGERLAFSADPSAETLLALHAALALGATIVPLHPRLTRIERAAAVSAAGARLLETAEIPDRVRRTRARAAFTTAHPDPLALVSTSGSSGVPKRVRLSARAFLANARGLSEAAPWGAREKWLVALPLAHVGGLAIAFRTLLARRTLVLEPAFDPERIVDSILRHRVTRLSVVPAMLDRLLRADDRGALLKLSLLMVGGSSAPRAQLTECARRGIRARTTWGLTEACSTVTLQCENGFDGDSGTPLSGVELAIPDSGRIRVRGEMLFSGYDGEPERDRSAWFETGDLGHLLPDGRLVVLGRADDMIVTGGENVSPSEIERALESCAGVRAALAFGVPDPVYGERVAAAIVPEASAPPDVRALSRSLESRLASFKRPRAFAFVESLPAGAGGKPDRRLARELALTPV